jgi:peptidyl-prolyl cis-trans isomerase D
MDSNFTSIPKTVAKDVCESNSFHLKKIIFRLLMSPSKRENFMSDNMASKLKRKISAKNATAMVLFGAIILVFVFFGLPSRMGGGFGSAARVNGTFISFADFENADQQITQMYSQFMGGRDFDPEQRKRMKQQALERLIYEELTAQAARKSGLKATDAEIISIITKDIPAFQKDGQFQREYYQAYLDSQHITAGEFENRVRKQLESMRLRRLFETSSRTLSLEADKQKTLQNYKMNLMFARLDDSAATGEMVTTAEAQKALEDKDFLKRVQTEFELKQASLSQKEEVRAQHILILGKEGDEAAQKKALEKIKEVKAKVGKEDFGTLAQKYSEDPGSKTKKGDLGFFGRGAMVKEFEDAAFTLPVGKVSEPIKTAYGYHLIKVLEKKAPKEATFENSKVQLAREILAKEKMQKKAQEIETMIASNPSAAEDELKKLGVKWEETGLFPLSADNVPKIQGLDTAQVAGLTPKSPWLNSIAKVNNARYVIKLKELKVDNSAPAEASILESIQRKRADGIFTTWLQDFRKKSDIEMNNAILQ